MEDFPEARFIHMVRDPVKMAGSSFRYYLASGRTEIDLAVSFVLRSCRSGEPVPPENREHWRAVRLEDLHADPKRTMSAICGWLGLPWHDRLLESTFNGLKYWNVKGSIQTSGFNGEITAHRFDDYISGFDRWRLGLLYRERFAQLGYGIGGGVLAGKVLQWALLPLFVIPLRMERITFALPGNRTNLAGMARAYVALRKVIVHYLLYPPPCAPTLF